MERSFYLGRYNCVEEIGSGPLGDVFRAKTYGVAGFEKQYALRRLHTDLCADSGFIRRFINAATSAAQLDHERIVRVQELNVQGAQYYLATDLVRGWDLARIFEALGERGEKMSTEVALLIISQLAETLAYTHARTDLQPTGVLHLGLSLSSVMITFDGDVKLLNAGLASPLVTPGWADSPRLLADLGYFSPEEVRGDPVDAAADVFSLGAIFYEMLAGYPAFPGDTAQEIRQKIAKAPPAMPAVDDAFVQILDKMLRFDPGERFGAMRLVGQALQPLLGRPNAARRALADLMHELTRPADAPKLESARVESKTEVARPTPKQESPAAPSNLPSLAGPTTAGAGDSTRVLNNPAATLAASIDEPTRTSAPALDLLAEAGASAEHRAAALGDMLSEVITDVDARAQAKADEEKSRATAAPSRNAEAAANLPPLIYSSSTELVPYRSRKPMVIAALAVLLGGSGIAAYHFRATLPFRSHAAAHSEIAVADSPAAANPEVPAPATPTSAALTAATPTEIAKKPTEATKAKEVAAVPAKSPEPTGAAGTLTLSNVPANAVVYIDGKQSTASSQVSAGEHRVIIAVEGQKMWRKTLRAGEALAVALEPAQLPKEVAGGAGLKVRCKTRGELRVFVDGADSGVTCPNEERISVSAGVHKLSLYSPVKGDFVGESEANVKGGTFSTRIHLPF